MALSRQTVESSYTRVYSRVDELPDYVVECRHPIETDLEMPDFSTVMSRGWQWIYAKTQSLQPLTFGELEQLNPSLEFREDFIESDGEKLYWGDLLLRLNDRFLPVFPH